MVTQIPETQTRDGVVGIRFVEAGPIHYCSPASLSLGSGDYIVVRTDRGERMGWVVLAADQILGANLHLNDGPVRVIDRLASEADVQAYRDMQARATEDISRAQAIATKRDPRVRVASLMYDLDGSHADLTFVARDQDDGEWLRRSAAKEFSANVQVEQVGDRDRAKSLGGLGQCGRALCCSSWQVEFPAISIKMAKDQGLAPNPSKISGVCGRLLCCLSFEVDAYREILGSLPKVGKRISTPVGRAKVISINAMTETVRMRMEDTNEIVEMPAAALREQYGTAVRPADLEDDVERAIHEQDRERRENFLGVLEPVSMPTAPRRPDSRPEGHPEGRPDRGNDSRPPRPDRPAGGRRDDASSTDRPARGGPGRPRRDGAPGDAPTGTSNARPGRPGIAARRSSHPGTPEGTDMSTGQAEAPRAERPPRDERPARPPRPADDAMASGEPGGDEEQKRRRRRGRRGGRGRGSEGAPESGTPATE